MKQLILLSTLLFVLNNCFAEEDKISVLIIDGYSNHDWRYTTEVINTLLLNSGFCEVEVSTAPTNDSPDYHIWNPDFSKYDVVVQSVNNLGNGFSWPESVQRNFENYLKQGGGMYVFHSANNSFAQWDEYNKMIGLGWRKAGEGTAIEIKDHQMVEIPVGQGKNTSHGPRVDLVVNKLTEHPINKGFPQKWLTPDIELYTYARGSAENMEVLSYTYDPKTDKNWPVDWVVKYGKGRVYNSTFGHLWHDMRMPQSIQCVGFQTTFLRAIQWLANEKNVVDVPADFPTEKTLSLKPFELVYPAALGWIDMMDADLMGWEVKCLEEDKNKVFWTVNNGVIECNSLGHPDHDYIWLMYGTEFADFELHLKFQIFKSSKGNSGIQFRSRYDDSENAPEGGWLNGPQVDIHPPNPMRTGLIYDETAGVNRWIYPSRPGWAITKDDFPPEAQKTLLRYADDDPQAWNTMEIMAEGMKIVTFVNGKRITNFDAQGILDDELHQKLKVGKTGKIALQLHKSNELLIRFKDLKIRSL